MSEGLHEPFEEIGEQREAEEAGIWIFLASEMIFFGAIFLGYTVYRIRYPEGFLAGAAELNLTFGLINSILLLSTSATMAMAVWAAKEGLRREVLIALCSTLALGLAFLVVKGFEYLEDIHRHLVPGSAQFPIDERGAEIFFSFYWAMTATHALHMAIGLFVIALGIWGVWKETIAWRQTAFIHVLGLYWNLVDVVWIFLFPLLYLVRAA